MTRQEHRANLTDWSLRQRRDGLGLSQLAFARQLGVAPESYRPWDAGRRPVLLDALIVTDTDRYFSFKEAGSL